jgi:hypothetical protein
MKKLTLLAGTLLLAVSALFAEPSGKTSIMHFQDVVILGRNEAVINTVAVSTTTTLATLAPARPTRAYVDIINVSGNTVSIGVVQSTQTAGLFDLADTKALSDVFPGLTGYTGAIYGRADSTDSVKVLEVY